MRIKIISDGTPWGTCVRNAEIGEEVEGCEKIEWSIVVGQELARAILTFVGEAAELAGETDAEVDANPCQTIALLRRDYLRDALKNGPFACSTMAAWQSYQEALAEEETERATG